MRRKTKRRWVKKNCSARRKMFSNPGNLQRHLKVRCILYKYITYLIVLIRKVYVLIIECIFILNLIVDL